jgi:hypothetical protein
MASPQLDEHHHDFFTAPHNVTTVFFTHTLSHPADSIPPSPTALAAAATLATLADGRPPVAYEDYEDDDEDDDYSGGISITSADLYEYTSASSMTDTYMTEQDVAEQQQQQQSTMAEFPSFPHPGPAFASDLPVPVPSYHIPSIQAPIPHLFSGHTSSSDPVLEPLPPIHQTHLTIEDNGSFMPITSFFHRISPVKTTVPGLDLVKPPHSVTQDQLQGDGLDPQGIDWFVRNVTRSHVRAKRAEWEAGQLSPSSHQTRKVCGPLMSDTP